VVDYVFRRLALDHLPYETRAEMGILSASERTAQLAGEDPAALAEEQDLGEMAQSVPVQRPQPPHEDQPDPHPAGLASQPHSSTELIEAQQGRTADAPLCLTCGTKMRPAGSCYVCEGCGATSGCS
jgi:ribonucleoside-diphosphate reductase alpha chain